MKYYFLLCGIIFVIGLLGNGIQWLWHRKHPPKPRPQPPLFVVMNTATKSFLVADEKTLHILRELEAKIESQPLTADLLLRLQVAGYQKL